MGRIVKEIEIEGKRAIALFDTGAYHSYVCKKFVSKIPKLSVRPYTIGLGGRSIIVDQICVVRGKIDGFDFDTKAVPVDEIGKSDGYTLDVIIGALMMEEWEIKLDPKTGTLDLEGLRRREFTEFIGH
jgi:predicted aspartyl protease